MWVCSGCVIALLLGTCVATGGERKWLFGEGVEVTLTNGQSLGDALSHDEAVRQLAVARDANKANLRKITTLKGEYSFADAFRFEGEIPLINSVTGKKMDTAQYTEMEKLLNFSAPFSGPGYWEVTRGFARFELDCRSDLYHAFYSPAEPVAFLNSQEMYYHQTNLHY